MHDQTIKSSEDINRFQSLVGSAKEVADLNVWLRWPAALRPTLDLENAFIYDARRAT